jgi:hypothetical protein
MYSTEAFEGEYTTIRPYVDRLLDELLPSRAPHWEIVYRATFAPWNINGQFSAANGFPLHLQDSINLNSLIVEGIAVGVVGHGLNYMWHNIDISALATQTTGHFFQGRTRSPASCANTNCGEELVRIISRQQR